MTVVLTFAAGILLAGDALAQSITESSQYLIPDDRSEVPAQPKPMQLRIESGVSSPSSIDYYEAQIDQLESLHGAYNSDLSEAALNLGIAFQLEGDHENAIESLRRALHVNRVNLGIYHPGKIPLIEQLIASYIATGDYEAAQDSYFRLGKLYERNFEDNDIGMLPGLNKLIEWHFLAYGERLGDEPIEHILQARVLIGRVINLIETHSGINDKQLLEYFAALLLTDYLIAVTTIEGQGFSQINTAGQMYSQGSRHIDEMIRISQTHEATDPQLIVDSLVMLADWHLVFGKTTSANEIYQDVWEQASLLPDNGRHLGELFDQPIRIPDFSIDATPSGGDSHQTDSSADDGDDGARQDLSPAGKTQIAVILQFDISTTGQAVKREVVEADPQASKNQVRRAQKRLRHSRFRPRYTDGIAVENPDVRTRYLFSRDPELILAEAKHDE